MVNVCNPHGDIFSLSSPKEFSKFMWELQKLSYDGMKQYIELQNSFLEQIYTFFPQLLGELDLEGRLPNIKIPLYLLPFMQSYKTEILKYIP